MSRTLPVVHVGGAEYSYPAMGQQSGLHVVTGPFTEVERSRGIGAGVDVFSGGYVWLFTGPRLLGYSIIGCDYGRYDEIRDAEVSEIAPWARSIAHLDHAAQLKDRRTALAILLERDRDEDTPDEREAWAKDVLSYGTEEELALPADAEWYERMPETQAQKVGRQALARLTEAEQQSRRAAVDALPPAHLDLPALTNSWTPWRLLDTPWRDDLATPVFWRYRQNPDDVSRDRVIRWAIGAGLSKVTVHRGLGVSRSTIDRVLGAAA